MYQKLLTSEKTELKLSFPSPTATQAGASPPRCVQKLERGEPAAAQPAQERCRSWARQAGGCSSRSLCCLCGPELRGCGFPAPATQLPGAPAEGQARGEGLCAACGARCSRPGGPARAHAGLTRARASAGSLCASYTNGFVASCEIKLRVENRLFQCFQKYFTGKKNSAPFLF